MYVCKLYMPDTGLTKWCFRLYEYKSIASSEPFCKESAPAAFNWFQPFKADFRGWMAHAKALAEIVRRGGLANLVLRGAVKCGCYEYFFECHVESKDPD